MSKTSETQCLTALLAVVLSGCATTQYQRTADEFQSPSNAETAYPTAGEITDINKSATSSFELGMTAQASSELSGTKKNAVNSATEGALVNQPSLPAVKKLAAITRTTQTGELQHASLTEVSGMSVSLETPGVLFALNDSGNSPTVFAFSEQGVHLGAWTINAQNRDWEDMSSVWLNGKAYLIIGDIGDNLKAHSNSTFYLVEEPTPGRNMDAILSPSMTLNFVYEDGPRNVEAFAALHNSIYLISKEPVTTAGPSASHLYELPVPNQFHDELLVARKRTSLPIAPANLESKLAVAMAGVDLNHITALDFDATSNSAYLLTYRHVIRIKRKANQSWAEAFSAPGDRIHSHNLQQAEALAVSANRAVWITSENRPAPLWAIPIAPPL